MQSGLCPALLYILHQSAWNLCWIHYCIWNSVVLYSGVKLQCIMYSTEQYFNVYNVVLCCVYCIVIYIAVIGAVIYLNKAEPLEKANIQV